MKTLLSLSFTLMSFVGTTLFIFLVIEGYSIGGIKNAFWTFPLLACCCIVYLYGWISNLSKLWKEAKKEISKAKEEKRKRTWKGATKRENPIVG